MRFLIQIVLCALAITPAHADPDADRAFVIGGLYSYFDLDPARTSASIDMRVLRGLHETLVVMGDDGQTPEPGAAASWDVSDDGLTYTFHLRVDARWSNGRPVVAEDFVAGWFRAMMPDTGGDYATMFGLIDGAHGFYEARLRWLEKRRNTNQDVSRADALATWRAMRDRFQDQVGVRALDRQTLQVRLARPAPYFLTFVSMVNFAPLPHDLPDQNVETLRNGRIIIDPSYFTTPDRLICNGPYRLERVIDKTEVALVANEHYWAADEVRSARIIQRAYPDLAALLAAYDVGQVQWVPTAYEGSEELLDSGRADVHAVLRPGTYYYQFNCRPRVDGRANPFADRAVRRALARTFDRAALAELMGRGAGPLDTFVPPGVMPGYASPAGAAPGFDLASAQRELADAGFADGQGLGRVGLLFNIEGTSPSHGEIALVIATHWRELGVTVDLQAVEFIEYLERSKRGEFHIRRAGWFGDYHDPTTYLDMLQSQSANNDAGYENQAFDDLLQRASEELDPAKRLALLQEAEAILLEDAVIVPIYRYAEVMLLDREKVAVPLNSWGVYRLERLGFIDR